MDTPHNAYRVQNALARRTRARVRTNKDLWDLFDVVHGEYIGTSYFCRYCRNFQNLRRRLK